MTVMSLLLGAEFACRVDELEVLVDAIRPPATEDLRVLDRAASVGRGKHARLSGLVRALIVGCAGCATAARLDAVQRLMGDELAPTLFRLGSHLDPCDIPVLECPDQLRDVSALIAEHEWLVDRYGRVVESAD